MAAPVTWDGSEGDGDWSVGANWDTGSVPITNDDVIVNSTAQNITAGMAQGAVDLGSLYIGPNFKGTIGAAGGPLVIAVSGTATSPFTSGLFKYASGGGDSFITAGTNGIDNAEIQHVTESTFYATGSGTYVILSTSRRAGPAQVTGTATVTTLNHISRNATGLKIASGTTITTCNFEGRYLESANDIATGNMVGPFKMTGTAKFGTIGNLYGGAIYMKHSSGIDAAVRAGVGSKFTPEGSPARAYTVTTMTEVEGATVIKDAPGVTGTFGTGLVIGSPSR